MRAAICYEFGKPPVIKEVTLDPPGKGEVRVRIAACGVISGFGAVVSA